MILRQVLPDADAASNVKIGGEVIGRLWFWLLTQARLMRNRFLQKLNTTALENIVALCEFGYVYALFSEFFAASPVVCAYGLGISPLPIFDLGSYSYQTVSALMSGRVGIKLRFGGDSHLVYAPQGVFFASTGKSVGSGTTDLPWTG